MGYNKEKWRDYKKTQISKPDYKERKAIWQKRYREKHKEQIKKYRKEYDLLNRDKVITHRIVNQKLGIEIKSKLCEGCNRKQAEHRHHPDYSEPLKVIFLCRSCHKKVHNSKS